MTIVRSLPALEELRFGSENLTDSNLDCLERLRSLRVLMLWGQIGDAGVEKLSRLPKLTELLISSPNVSDDGLKNLARLETLEKLTLSSSTITDAGVCELSRLSGLKQLYLDRIPGISEECLDGLREARSGIAIVNEPYGPPP
jgi:hypothetical protein